MKTERYFLKGSKLPDLIVIPTDFEKPRKDANEIEKIIFYREKAKGKSKIMVVSKKAIKKVGGFDSNLGFGEDRLYEKKLFLLFKLSYREKSKFKI
jgi:hypothetical protein